MDAPQLLAASALVALALSAAGAGAQPSQPAPTKAKAAAAPANANAATAAAKSNATASASPTAALPSRRTPFTYFGSEAAIELRGDGATSSLSFGNRGDELVTRATLHLLYTYSPALAPGTSLIRIALNDEEVGTLAVSAKDAGTELARDIEIDPRLVVGSNKLTMTLTAAQGEPAQGEPAQGATPADDARPGLWAEVSGASELEIAYRPLAIADDLAILPEPFFDERDQRRVVVPFVFAAEPSAATLNAAAIVASWLGQLAQWRGARFPTSLEAAAPGHAIAFVANNERPAFLASVPQAAGPELRMMTNPADGHSKLLLVMGRDAADLKRAALSLVLGNATLSGPAAKLAPVENPVRAAYDAPLNVKLDRPIKLAELLEWPGQLETAGKPPALPPVRADLRVPPDLAAWRGPGVPMELHLEYGPTACVAEAELEIAINGDPFSALAIPTANKPVEDVELYIPAQRLRPRMRLQFTFRFTPKEGAGCRQPAPAIKASVSPESTVDFSGFPHYVQMPNLNHFATVGFPFTKFADLSQTVVVLPERPSAADIQAMLGLMGRMGEASGYPATRVRLATSRDAAQLADADLLVIGATPQQALLVDWANRLPVMLTGYAQRVARAQPTRLAAVRDWLGIGTRNDLPPPAPVSFDGGGPVAAVFGFESPVTPGRSVVAVTAVSSNQVLHVLDALEDANQRKAMRGNAAFILPGKVESALVGETYDVGFMPPWTGATYWLADNPVVLGTLVGLGMLLFAGLVWFAHWRITTWRARSAA
ncbi:MAG TPA: cellulose biosynthesis cyclic di-GMP-binding regulatory protein BcsB [Usitatibacter sp.]|nr:cellulose biosynthesis cyclic di-GMP-binding regulatory protein BcsB [Usitatibacter sp.]